MSVLFVDPVGGIAGDMMVAALLDLGADIERIRQALDSLPVEGISVKVEPCQRGPFAAQYFSVRCTAESPSHRHWSELRTMLQSADFPPGVTRRALAVFGRLAESEAAVHGTPVDTVHFHEVGAWDSIADIVGVAVALEQLGVSRIVAAPPPLSSGTITTAHGQMPLPAPATLALLTGWPVRSGPDGRECTTPTGAAILAALAEPGPMPAMRIIGTGVGAGTRDPADHPNILRAVLGEALAEDSDDATPTTVHILKAQMDDMSGEHLPPLINALLAAGALDAYASPVLMKKGRSGLLVTAICAPDESQAVAIAMLRHGTTFGVRVTRAERTILDRWFETVTTPWGAVQIKVGAMNGEVLQAAPEYEDIQRIAAKAGQATLTVHAAAMTAWHNQQDST